MCLSLHSVNANPIIPRSFLTSLVNKLRPLGFITSRQNIKKGSPAKLQGGLSPDFFARPPRQISSYGSPQPQPSASFAPISSGANSYSSPSSNSGDSYGSPAAPALNSGGDSYGSPAAPALNSGDSYGSPAAPALNSGDSYGSPAAPALNSGDSYGSPAAPAVGSGDSYGSPASDPIVPSYGSSSNNCDVIRSLTRVGDDCQQGGQECQSQCTTTQEQECTTEYEQQCTNVNEQVCF